MEKTLTRLHANYNSETNLQVPGTMHQTTRSPSRINSKSRLKDNSIKRLDTIDTVDDSSCADETGRDVSTLGDFEYEASSNQIVQKLMPMSVTSSRRSGLTKAQSLENA